jgi:hypothetical protein
VPKTSQTAAGASVVEMMLPVDAWWNSVATLENEARQHEAGHAAAAHLLGFEVVEIFMDAKHGDWGKLGAVRSRWTGPIDDVEELSFARAVVAAAGPYVRRQLGTRPLA